MAKKILQILAYRRKREGRTNYKRRLALLKSRKPRLVIRKTNTQIILQIVEYQPDGDKILCGTSSLSLKKLGWSYSCKSLPACYLTGLLLGSKAKGKIKDAILDIGLQTPVKGSRIYAALKGVKTVINIPSSEEIFSSDERLVGTHIKNYDKAKKDGKFTETFEKIKGQLM